MGGTDGDRHVVLAIDMGTSGPKVCLVDDQGAVLDQEFRPTELLLLAGGGQEQRPQDWWTAIDAAARSLLSRRPALAQAVRAVAVTTQWSGTVAVDREGEPLMNAIGWMDTRGAPQIARITDGFPSVQQYGVGRALTWIRLTGGAPGQSGKDSLAHILWIRDNAQEIYARTHKFLEPKDWINQRLTGRFAASYDSIALHWSTDNRDPHRVAYHPKLLAMTGLPRDKLPDLLPSTAMLGPITARIAKDWGLAPEVQVVMGTPDLHAAALGSGGVDDFDPHIYVGTSSWLTCHVPFKKTDILHNMASLPSAIPGRYLLMNAQETAGACLNWLRDRVFFPEDTLHQGEPPENLYAAFDTLAETAEPGCRKLLFAPWLVGERTPVEDHSVRGGWLNLSLDTTRAEMVRSVMEGVALNAHWLLDAVEGFCKRRFDSLRIIGGGAKSATWCQIYADVLGRTIRQMAEPLAAGARGAACLSLVGSGKLDFETFGRSIRVERVFEPRPEHAATYAELSRELRQFYKRNRTMYRRLNSL